MTFKEIAWNSAAYRQTLQLREEVLRIPIGLALYPDDVASDHEQFHFTITDGELLRACVVAKPLNRDVVKLRQMAVSPLHQGSGIGRELIGCVERVMQERGFRLIELSARQTAMGFYTRLGYQSHGEQYLEQGIPHVHMTKQLRNRSP